MAKTKKSLAIVLAFVMMIALIPTSAFAASTNTVLNEPFTVTDDEGIPLVKIDMELGNGGMDTNEQRVRLDITNGEWDMDSFVPGADADETNVVTTGAIGSAPLSISADGGAVGVTLTNVFAADDDYVEFGFKVDSALAKYKSVQFALKLKSGEDVGPVKVKLNSLAGQLSSNEFTVAIVSGGNTTASVKGDPENMTREAKEGATIQIREAAVNSVNNADGQQSLEFRLPSGVTWDKGQYRGATNVWLGGDMVSTGAISGPVFSNSDRTMTWTFSVIDTPDVAQIMTFKPFIVVGKDAKKGDIAIQIKQTSSGDYKIENASDLVVAVYGDEDVTVTAAKEADLPEIISGREYESGSNAYEVEVTLEENMAGALTAGRFVDFEFPSWVQGVNSETVEVKINNNTQGGAVDTFNWKDDNSTFEWKVPSGGVSGWKANSTNKIKFKIPITVEANKTGDIELTVSGDKAGVSEQKVVVGKAVAPISLEATVSDIKAGIQKQTVNDITIKENAIGAIRDDSTNNKLVLYVDNANAANMGFKKGDNFKAEVISGDLEIKNADIDNGTIELTIDNTSLKNKAEIKVSGLVISSDRTPAEGKYDLIAGGNSVVDNQNYLNHVSTGAVQKGDFTAKAATLSYLNVITPADQGVNAAYVIGSKDYTVNGVTKSMDVAPYIDGSGRTMMPIRYVADAMGITEDQITWTQASQTSTIFGKNTVTIKVGENTITSNGTPIVMDTVAVNKDGRVFVPVRFVANALGASVGWDAATKTVSVYTVK